ncbi:hypothetical protein BDZ85DRAFT_2379 [Elsinoe ampelina]|uniref:Uncharacterized protein n=1 Tax=Elsinoe ampelina TaxID=302913 RepID=A0A6A6GNL7_9PEZI|nr:hypothetical protein BDZ85DRAFT_2379 [Elsinoe ampelina]
MGVTPIRSAAELFSSIDSMPSCSKIATMALISSCDQLTSDDGNQITDLQSLYAVRLAICELELVDAEMPVECSNFSPTRDMIHKITLMSTIKNGLRAVFTYHPTGYDTAAHSKLCARALQNHGTGTGWTSYSNNLQNAGNICKAKKMDLLADEILRASEFLHESKTAFNDSLRDMINRTTTFTTDLAKQDKDASAYFDQINLLFAFLNNYTAAAGNAVQSLKPINDMTGQLNLNMQTALANSGSDGVLGRIWQISSELSVLRGDLSDYQEEVHVRSRLANRFAANNFAEFHPERQTRSQE